MQKAGFLMTRLCISEKGLHERMQLLQSLRVENRTVCVPSGYGLDRSAEPGRVQSFAEFYGSFQNIICIGQAHLTPIHLLSIHLNIV